MKIKLSVLSLIFSFVAVIFALSLFFIKPGPFSITSFFVAAILAFFSISFATASFLFFKREGYMYFAMSIISIIIDLIVLFGLWRAVLAVIGSLY